MTLTEAGATYLMRVDAILAALDDADHEARGTGEVRGSLRVGMSSSFVLREIIPRLPVLYEAVPGAEDKARGERPLPRPRDRGHRRGVHASALRPT